jgi:AbrB family looped-hinge helix DNA binding protein
MAVVLAIYGFVDLLLLLAAKVVDERVRPIFHLCNRDWKGMRRQENAIERMCPLDESTMRWTKINGKGQVTIPADLRERFGIRKGTRIEWTRDGARLVLTPVALLRKKS